MSGEGSFWDGVKEAIPDAEGCGFILTMSALIVGGGILGTAIVIGIMAGTLAGIAALK